MAERRAPQKRKSMGQTKKRRIAIKRASQSIRDQSNQKAQWTTYRMLQANITKAWNILKRDIHEKASPDILARDSNHLRLLLGECNYMVSECMKMSRKRSI